MSETATLPEREQKQELTSRGQQFLELAQGLKVIDDDSFRRADLLNTEGAKSIKAVENFINPHIQRAHEAHKALTSDRARMIEPIQEGRKIIGQKMAGYHSELERKRKEEEARLAEEARKNEEQARKAEEDRRLTEAQTLESQGRKEEAEQVLNAPDPVPRQMVAPTPRTAIPKTQTTFRDKWEYEVLDKSKVPEEYKVVDQGALNRVAQATKGKMAVAGCKIIHKRIPVGRIG